MDQRFQPSLLAIRNQSSYLNQVTSGIVVRMRADASLNLETYGSCGGNGGALSRARTPSFQVVPLPRCIQKRSHTITTCIAPTARHLTYYDFENIPYGTTFIRNAPHFSSKSTLKFRISGTFFCMEKIVHSQPPDIRSYIFSVEYCVGVSDKISTVRIVLELVVLRFALELSIRLATLDYRIAAIV